MGSQPVHSHILTLIYNCMRNGGSGLNVNSIYKELVADKTISKNKKPVIDAIRFLTKSNLIETIREGKQKEIKVLTQLGKDFAKLVIDLRNYIDATSELRDAVRQGSINVRDSAYRIEFLISPYEVTNVIFIRYISILSKIKDNKSAKIILNDIIVEYG